MIREQKWSSADAGSLASTRAYLTWCERLFANRIGLDYIGLSESAADTRIFYSRWSFIRTTGNGRSALIRNTRSSIQLRVGVRLRDRMDYRCSCSFNPLHDDKDRSSVGIFRLRI